MINDDMFNDLSTFDDNDTLENIKGGYTPSLNRVYLVGNLVDAPTKAYTKTDKPVTTFTIYVKRPFSDRETGKKEVDFIDIEVWDKQAENCEKFLEKGSKVAIVGRLRITKYTDKNDVIRNQIRIVADNVNFM